MGAVLYTADARLLCPLCFTKEDITASRRRVAFDGGAVALIGAIATVIPFVAHAVAALQVAADGGAGHHTWIALGAGAVAAACGWSTVLSARERASGGWLVAGALVMLLGAYHLARAAGLIG